MDATSVESSSDGEGINGVTVDGEAVGEKSMMELFSAGIGDDSGKFSADPGVARLCAVETVAWCAAN